MADSHGRDQGAYYRSIDCGCGNVAETQQPTRLFVVDEGFGDLERVGGCLADESDVVFGEVLCYWC